LPKDPLPESRLGPIGPLNVILGGWRASDCCRRRAAANLAPASADPVSRAKSVRSRDGGRRCNRRGRGRRFPRKDGVSASGGVRRRPARLIRS
jgi:hypothetical protein